MKAAVYDQTGGPEVFRYADIDEPQLRKGGVLIDVRFVGIRAGTCCTGPAGFLHPTLTSWATRPPAS